jgi:streptomycin 6-kinase
MDDLVIPQRLREASVAWEGENARTWLAELPRIVAEVAEAWGLEVGPPFEPGGNISWVAPCTRRGDATPLVLKVQLPHPESAPEGLALAAWDGHGAVRLHEHDPGRRALLLERCAPGTDLHGERDVGAAFDAATALVRDLHAAPVPPGLPALGDVLAGWADHLEDRRPLLPEIDDDVWSLVQTTMRSPGGISGTSVLLHGDLNPTNVLSSARGWLAIDPKPMVGDPAYDAARTILQLAPEGDDPVAVVGARIARSAAALDVDQAAIATWCLVDVLETGGFAAATGDPAEAGRLLAMLAWIRPHLG